MRTSSVLALTCLLAVSCGRTGEQTGSVEGAAAALGADDLTSLQFTASGRMFSVGQPPTADEGWPPVDVRTYRAAMDYESETLELELVRFMEGDMPRGGGAPFRGEQRQHQIVSGEHAWNVPQPPAGGAAPGGAPPAQPQPAAVADRRLLLWSTPHGFVKAAAANDAATRTLEGQTEVSFNIDGRRVVGFINDNNEIERVQTWSDNPVMGDMLVETTYTDYQDFDGVRFPSRIEQTQGGHPSLELTVSSVQANPTLDISVPENVRNAAPPAAQQATSERLADGVFWITGGSHHSMAVDMGDHAVVIEAPLNEARSEAVIAETNRLMPDKPIRYVVNTHLHFDHSGGLRTFADEGATVVTHEANQSFFERAWAAPRAIAPDRLATSGRAPAFEGVRDTHVLPGAGKRTIELHVVEGNPHSEQTLIAWLPVERILFQSDMMNPPAPNATVPPPTPAITNFYENVQRLGLQPRQIVGGHGGRVGTVGDLRQVAGQGAT